MCNPPTSRYLLAPGPWAIEFSIPEKYYFKRCIHRYIVKQSTKTTFNKLFFPHLLIYNRFPVGCEAKQTEVQNKPQKDGVSNSEEEQSMCPIGEVVGNIPHLHTA